ncbi:MAG: hypothetical protein AAF639_32755 [Chloroflexota bacterium]
MKAFSVAMIAIFISALIIWSLVNPDSLQSMIPDSVSTATGSRSSSPARDVPPPQPQPQPASDVAPDTFSNTTLPATSTPAPANTPEAARTTNRELSDPVGFINAYYTAFGNKDVERAWSMISYPVEMDKTALMSDEVRFDAYRERMLSYRSVDVQNIRLISLTPPVVEAIVTYEHTDTARKPEPSTLLARFTLVEADDETIPWRIRRVESEPYP